MAAKGCLIHLGGNYKFIFDVFFCHVEENSYLCALLETKELELICILKESSLQ